MVTYTVGSVRSIILSRFILDLRYDPGERSYSTRRYTELEFATRELGTGLGASLNTIWGSGIDGNQEDVEDVPNLEYPMVLLGDRDNSEIVNVENTDNNE